MGLERSYTPEDGKDPTGNSRMIEEEQNALFTAVRTGLMGAVRLVRWRHGAVQEKLPGGSDPGQQQGEFLHLRVVSVVGTKDKESHKTPSAEVLLTMRGSKDVGKYHRLLLLLFIGYFYYLNGL